MKYKYLPIAEQYASDCRGRGELANRAGFLRKQRLSPRSFDEYCEKHTDEAALIKAVFEDEALNGDTKKLSATVLNMYMKTLLGQSDGEDIRIVCGQQGDDLL